MNQLSKLLWRVSRFKDKDGVIHHCMIFDESLVSGESEKILKDIFFQNIPEWIKDKIPFAAYGTIDPFYADGKKKVMSAIKYRPEGVLFLDTKNGKVDDCPIFDIKVRGSYADPNTYQEIAKSVQEVNFELLDDGTLELLESISLNDLDKLEKSIEKIKKIAPSAIIAGLHYECTEAIQFLIQKGILFSADELIRALNNRRLEFDTAIEMLNELNSFSLKESSLINTWSTFSHNSDVEKWIKVRDLFVKKGIKFSDKVLKKILKETHNGDNDYFFILDNCENSKKIVDTMVDKVCNTDNQYLVIFIQRLLDSGGDFSKIRKINLTSDKLVPVPNWIYKFESLEVLILSGFNSISAEISQLNNLKAIDISSVSKITEEIKDLNNLEVLVININQVDKLKNAKLISLQELYLYGDGINKLTEIPNFIFSLTNLERLVIENCSLNSLPKQIDNLNKLCYLNLSSNNLKELPEEIGNLKNLTWLHLSDNKDLITLPFSITRLNKLNQLDITSNKKLKLPKEFGEMNSLEKHYLKELKKYIIKDEQQTINQIFAGQKWCVTGTFKNYKPREKALELIEAGGGIIGKSVDKTITHLLAGEKAGDKIEKAKKLKVKIINEEAFEEMLKSANNQKEFARTKIELKDTTLRDSIFNCIRNKKWDVDVKYIESLLRPSISISTQKGKPKVGQSKIGGKPDLPKIIKWPFIYDENEDGTMPLTFIAQFNIREFKLLDFQNLLPEKGMIYLFMYFLTDGAQDEYASGGNNDWIKVLYYNGDLSELKSASIPKKLKDMDDEYCVGVLEESVLSFKEDYTLPSNHDFNTLKKLSKKDNENLDELINNIIPSITNGHTESQFFGYPQAVQSFGFSEPPEKVELPIFFQLSERLGDFKRCISDGSFYFYIDKDDLLRADFKNVSCDCQYT